MTNAKLRNILNVKCCKRRQIRSPIGCVDICALKYELKQFLMCKLYLAYTYICVCVYVQRENARVTSVVKIYHIDLNHRLWHLPRGPIQPSVSKLFFFILILMILYSILQKGKNTTAAGAVSEESTEADSEVSSPISSKQDNKPAKTAQSERKSNLVGSCKLIIRLLKELLCSCHTLSKVRLRESSNIGMPSDCTNKSKGN